MWGKKIQLKTISRQWRRWQWWRRWQQYHHAVVRLKTTVEFVLHKKKKKRWVFKLRNNSTKCLFQISTSVRLSVCFFSCLAFFHLFYNADSHISRRSSVIARSVSCDEKVSNVQDCSFTCLSLNVAKCLHICWFKTSTGCAHFFAYSHMCCKALHSMIERWVSER